MRPTTPVESNPRVHSTPIRHASGSSQISKPSLEIARFPITQPVFSDESSDTHYSSSSGEDDAHGNGHCIESKPKDETQDEHMRDPTSAALPSISPTKMQDLQQGSRFGISSPTGGVVNGQTALAHPSIIIPIVGIKPAPLKERHAVIDGKMAVIVDLDDSDEEKSPLCIKCRDGVEHKEPELLVPKAADNEEVLTPKVTLVVDLSGTSPSQVNHTPTTVGESPNNGTPLVDTNSASSKACGTQVGAPMNFVKAHMNTNGKPSDSIAEHTNAIASNSNVKLVERIVETSRENIKTISLISNETTEIEVESRKIVSLVPGGKQTERKVTTSKTVSLKSTGKQTEKKVEIRREHVKTALPAGDDSEDEASTISEDYRRGIADGHHFEGIRPDWSLDVLCDLCERGPSLSLGAWYSWCCGNPSTICKCSNEEQQRRKKQLVTKGGKSWRAGNPSYPWTGKVHKLCGLWSAEVFEDAKQPYRIMNLYTALQRSRKSKCSDPDCGIFGATLGCRVASCKKNFHYPCADKLSVTVKVRMWDGLMKPIACKDHRDINDVLDDLKIQKEKKEIQNKKRKRGKKTLLPLTGASGPSLKLEVRPSGGDIIDIESSGEEDITHNPSVHEVLNRLKTPNISSPGLSIAKIIDASDSLLRDNESGPKHFGKNLLCADFTGGLEPVSVPCTNDVDTEPPPYLEYITKSRYEGQPLGNKKKLHLLLEREAKACDGCARHDPDDPFAPLSVHIPFERREDDFREDWLRERMYGRLPYDKYARLVIGTDYNELVECNDRCKCGDSCINREMQKGLRTPIELYKTENKGWAVRTLVPIPRGRFVIEYVGEMLTQDQAQSYGQIYDEIKRSYLYDLDYPESRKMPDFTLDGFHASNVARFINHSCDANLKIYRVYVETTYKWLSRIGMYAMRDIDAGEELSYDYNYGRHDLQVHDGSSHSSEAGSQKTVLGNDSSTHIKCHCGAKNCREWLWRPMHVGDDESEDE